jgi:hypothetical protein
MADLKNTRRRLWASTLSLALVFIAFVGISTSKDPIPTGAAVVAHVVGSAKCGECHEFELQTLVRSRHHKSFNELHKNRKALAIVERLGGEKRIDKRKDCASCHYTHKVGNSPSHSPELVAGVACESCHGAARRWWNLHWKGAGEKLARNMKKSEQRGMVRPHDLMGLVDRCLDCHLVTDEVLVSKGRHPSGVGFEMVSWFQGEVRHNFMKSEIYGANPPSSRVRQRQFYVLGRLRQLERGLRAFGHLKDRQGSLGKELGKGLLVAYGDLKKLRGPIKELGPLREILAKVRLKESSKEALQKAAAKVAEITSELLAEAGKLGSNSIDPLIPKTARGKVSEFRQEK